MHDTQPQDRIWDVHWSHGRLCAPDRSPLPLVWGDTPDMATAHAALDAWAATSAIETQLPRAGAFSLWWILRIKLVQIHLPAWLPVLRALRPFQGHFDVLRLHAPPAPWWPALLQSAFPGAAVETVSIPPPNRALRVRALAARLLRALSTARRLARIPAPASGRPRVLVVSRARAWNGHTDTEMGPVLAALESQGAEVIVLDQAHEGLVSSLRTWHTRPKTHLFGDYIFLSYSLRHGMAQPPLPPILREDLLSPPAFHLEGHDLTALLTGQLRRDAAEAYRGFTTCVDSVPRLLRRLQVDVLLTTDESGGELGIVMGAVTTGIPTVALQHGCIHADHLAYMFPLDTNPADIPLCNQTCVYGPHYAELLTTQSIYQYGPPAPLASHFGVPCVTITGQPQADARAGALRPWGERSTEGLRLRQATLPEGCDLLLLLSSQELLVDYLQATILPALAAAGPRHALVIRPHPREWDVTSWERAIALHGLQRRAFLRKGEALDPWLDACDVHLAATSTTLAEATLMGRPNILLGVREFGDWMDCLKPGVAVDLAAFTSLDAAVDYWLNAAPEQVAQFEARRSRYLAAHFHTPDQQAAQRVAAVVLQTARGPNA